MPVDIRKLMFSHKELEGAFKDYCQNNKLVDRQSPFESFAVENTKDFRGKEFIVGKIYFSGSSPKNPILVKLDQNQLLEVLIATCKSLSIPLPRHGSKFLQIHKDNLVMVIGLNEKELKIARNV